MTPYQAAPQEDRLTSYKPKSKRANNELVAYDAPPKQRSHFKDEYQPRERPFMAKFCEPRFCLLLLLILFFGLLLLIFIILMIMSLDKGDPDNLAGWNYMVPPRGPDGGFVGEFGERYGTSVHAAGEFLIVSSPNRKNDNGSTGAVFIYVWLGSLYAVYGSGGIMVPPDPDVEPQTWLSFNEQDNKASREEKEANRVNFDNDSQNAVKWADDGTRIIIGVPGSSSVVVYDFAWPLKESAYVESIAVNAPYEEGGRNVAISKDGSRVALTARFNQTLAYAMGNATATETIAPISNRQLGEGERWLEDTNSTNCTDGTVFDANSTNCTARPLPHVIQIWDWVATNNTWTQTGDFIKPVGEANDSGDWGVNMQMNLEGDTIAVSNPTWNNVGLVQVFRLSDGTWEQVGKDIKGDQEGGNLGFSMAITGDGNEVLLGNPLSYGGNGTAIVYRLKTGLDTSLGTTVVTSWQRKGTEFLGDGAGAMFGYAVDIAEDGNSIIVGSPKAYGGIGKMNVYDWYPDRERWFPYVDLPQRDQYGEYAGHGNYGSAVSMTNNGDSIMIAAPNTTNEDDGTDYVEFFDKAPKGMDLTGRTRPQHVLAEHPDDDEFKGSSASYPTVFFSMLAMAFSLFYFL